MYLCRTQIVHEDERADPLILNPLVSQRSGNPEIGNKVNHLMPENRGSRALLERGRKLNDSEDGG